MVLTLVEYDEEGLDDVSLQALTLARDVAEQADEPLEAIAFGAGAADVAGEAGDHGVDLVVITCHTARLESNLFFESCKVCISSHTVHIICEHHSYRLFKFFNSINGSHIISVV